MFRTTAAAAKNHDQFRDPHGNKLANVRVDFVNGVDAADGLVYSLRSIDRTGTIFTRKGYDDVTGVGTPYGARYVYALGH